MADTKFGRYSLDTPIAIEPPPMRAPKYGRAEPLRDESLVSRTDHDDYEPSLFSTDLTYEAPEPVLHADADALAPIIHQPESLDLSDACDPIVDAIELDASSLIVEDEPAELMTTDVVAIADEACGSETQILAAGAMPPERVKFTAPLEAMVEGHGDLHRGVVLNLSSTGLACAMSLELTPGQRIWVRFKLNLAEEPLSLLCAVIWRRDANPKHVLYGLQFTSLAEDEATRIDTTVRERLDGRAADWPLPLMPTGEAPRPTSRKQTSTWTSAAFGMIGGMALALALSALPHIMSAPADDELPVAQVAHTQPVAAPPVPAVVAAQVPEPTIAVPSPDAIAGTAQDAPHLALASAPAMAKPEGPKVDAAKSDSAAKALSKAEIAKAEAKLAKDPPNGGLLPRKAGSTSAEVTIAGAATQKARGFWLDNPRRYVVDIPGKHGAAKSPEGSNVVSRVRTGTYDDKTRYVMEVASNVHDARVEPRGNALVITLSR